MKDKYADRGSFSIEASTGSANTDVMAVGAFPIEAFEATSPSSSVPTITVRDGWSLESAKGSRLNFAGNTDIPAASMADADILTVYDSSQETYRGVTLANLKTYLGL